MREAQAAIASGTYDGLRAGDDRRAGFGGEAKPAEQKAMWFEGIAWAAEAPAQGGMDQIVWTMIIPFAMLAFVFATFTSSDPPQTQKTAEHQKMLACSSATTRW